MDLTTDRLVIERLSDEDAHFIECLVNQPSFVEFIGDKGVTDKLSALRYLNQGPLASYRQHGFGLYKVSSHDDNQPLGICGLVKRDSMPYPDIGFAFLNQHCGKGYAFEAASAVIDYEHHQSHHATICAIADLNNNASKALLVKLGFELIGEDRRPDCGEFEPAHYFELNLAD